MTWVPLSKRNSSDGVEQHTALVDGVPKWLQASLVGWINQAARTVNFDGHFENLDPTMGSLQRRLRRDWVSGFGRTFGDQQLEGLLDAVARDEKLALDVADCLLGMLVEKGRFSEARALDGLLNEAGSAWKVGDRGRALERRLDEPTTARAECARAGSDRASEHLRSAWTAMYGRNPRPSEAYRDAVKAVEVAAIPVVCPQDGRATLGKVISCMAAKPSKWRTTLTPSPPADPVGTVIGMMQVLWKGQLDRHGSPDVEVPVSVGHSEAEAALHLALTLTHWLRSGAVAIA